MTSVSAVFPIVLTNASDSIITVDYRTVDGTAKAGTDYTATTGTLTFMPGETSKTISVPVNSSAIGSKTEKFSILLSNPYNAKLTNSTGTCTITGGSDNVDSAFSVTSSPVTLTPTAPALTPLSTSGNQFVDPTGTPVRLNAYSWYGFDGPDLIVHGLYAGRGYKDMLDQFRALGFDTVRLLFCDDFINSTLTFNDSSGNQYVDGKQNPDLIGLTPMQAMDAIIYYCSTIGMRVILDQQRISMSAIVPPASANNGFTWNDPSVGTDGWPAFDYASGTNPENAKYLFGGSSTPALYRPSVEWKAMWTGLATHFTSNNTVPGISAAGQYSSNAGLKATILGFEPHNEPYQLPWETWASMCEALFSAVNSIAPDWIMFVHGVGDNRTTTGPAATSDAYWWGGYLKGVATRPVNLGSKQNKLAYVVHEYAHSVSAQTWLSSNYTAGGTTTSSTGAYTGTYPALPARTVANYPNNLEAVYDAYWGFIYQQNIAPIWVGEFGGGFGLDYSTGAADPLQVNADYEKQWIGALVKYMNGNRNDGSSMVPAGGVSFSYGYFSLNPESGNPIGGLVQNNDYKTLQVEKMKFVQPLLQGVSIGTKD